MFLNELSPFTYCGEGEGGGWYINEKFLEQEEVSIVLFYYVYSYQVMTW